jgi:serine/threonine protein kinase
VIQAVHAVLAIQRAGVIHTDLFERNFMVTGDGGEPLKVVLLDFGDAKSALEPPDFHSTTINESHPFGDDRTNTCVIMERTLGWNRTHELILEGINGAGTGDQDDFERTLWQDFLFIESLFR